METNAILAELEDHQSDLMMKCDELYTSLNIVDDFPNLEGLTMRFMQHLLFARDLKINVRQRAIASFFEWEKLTQAAAGRHATLGNVIGTIFGFRYVANQCVFE